MNIVPRLRLLPALLLLSCFTRGLIAQTPGGHDAYVAKAGETFISEAEFLRRFEMLPGLNRKAANHLDEEKLTFLYSLIAEKLLAQEAKARRLDEDSVLKASFNEVRKMLARDELYRDEITRKVAVSKKELDLGVSRALRQLFIKFIYVDKKESAEFIRSQLHTRGDVDRLMLDSTMHAVRDTATVIWGDAESGIEEACYRLKAGALSPVVQGGDGYYIVLLVSNLPNSYYAAMPPSDLRANAKEIIRKRKEHALTLEFVQNFLRDKMGYSRPVPYKLLAVNLQEAYQRHEIDTVTKFDRVIYDEVKSACASALKDTFVVAGTTWWSTQDVLQKLYAKGLDIHRGNTRSIPRLLNDMIRDWVYDELLAQEALARQLDTRPAVRRELDVWHQQFLAEMMKAFIRRHIAVSDAEVWAAMHAGDAHFELPMVKIRELKTRNADDMKIALDELQGGASFETVIGRWSDDAEMRRTQGLLGFFPVTDHPPVGEIAWEMNAGDRYGPLAVGKEFVYFELLGKDSASVPADSAGARNVAAAKEEVYRMKVKRTTDEFLAQSGQRRGFSVYKESLEHLKVSPVPMMTFRLLGFGGRMFASPFVTKYIDWVNVDPPTTTIIP